MTRKRTRVAVIGAGIGGLSAARALAAHAVEISIFDKGRSVGGRVATRRVEAHSFDLGAQYFTARDARFKELVGSWLDDGACAPWLGRIVAVNPEDRSVQETAPLERFVGTPGMNAIAHHLAKPFAVRSGHRVDRIERTTLGFLRLFGAIADAGQTLAARAENALGDALLGEFDAVLVSLPADQSAQLLLHPSPSLAAQARETPLDPCFAIGVVAGDHDDALRALPFDGAFIGRDGDLPVSPLSWIARDSSKPGRPEGEQWVLHASSAWTRANTDLPTEEVTKMLLAELARLFDLTALSPQLVTTQRWAYARALHPSDRGASFDDDAKIGIGGDWMAGGKIEGAFISGVALAERLLSSLGFAK